MARECCQSVAHMAASSSPRPFFKVLALRRYFLALDDPVQKTCIIAKLTGLGESKFATAGDIPSQNDVKDIARPQPIKSK